MKLHKFKTIRNNLTFWFLLLALSPLLIGTLITYNQRIKAIEQESFDKLTAIRDLKVQQVEDWLGHRISDMQVMSGDFEIRALEGVFGKTAKSTGDINTLEIARELLKRNQRSSDNFEELFILNAKTGFVEISTNKSFEGENKSQDPYFTNPLKSGEFYIKDIHFSKTMNRAQMTFSIPIFGLKHNTQIAGILVARIDLEKSLYNLLLNRVGLGKTGETLIVNKEGFALNELRSYENAVLKLQIKAEPVLKATNGETGITVTKDYRDENILAAYTYIPETAWGFVCKQDLKELNAPITEMLWNLILLFIVAGLLIILVVTWISKSISNPIVNLEAVAQKLTEGDLSARSTLISNDEIGSLALSFNKMADNTASKLKVLNGVTDISNALLNKSSMQEFANSLLKHLMKLSDANMSTFYILNEVSMEYEHFASVGANEKMLNSFSAKNPQGEFGNVLSTKKIFYLKDIPENTIFKFKTVAGDAIPKEIITIPVLVDEVIVAIILLVNINKFSTDYLETLKQSRVNLNTSYSNLIATERTSVLAEHLSLINQQLEVQSEELQDQAEELQQTSEELQEQNLELEAQRKHVELANKLKSEFLSNMSHELRTPLNSIMALSRVLIMQAKDKLTDKENNYLEIVERNGKRLLSLINNILDLSKIEAGKMEILPNFISLAVLLQIIKENMQSLAEEKHLVLTLSIPDDLPKIETDESKLYQILTNIIGNAVKFTEKGNVDISVKHDFQNVFIEVKDTGIGIAKNMLPHIFDEFRQADGTTSRQYEGTGLGLAIANKMTKILGGKITAKSKIGKGTVFVVMLPIKWHKDFILAETFNPKTNLSKSKEIKTPDIDANNNASKQISKKRILIVEDNPDNMVTVSAILKGKYNILEAVDGKKGVKLAQSQLPDIILLDMSLPKKSGEDIIKKLKKNSKTRNIPVIAVTAQAMKGDEKKFLNAGCNGYIAKPIDPEALLMEIERLLKSH